MMADRFLNPLAARVEFYETVPEGDRSHFLSACFARDCSGFSLTFHPARRDVPPSQAAFLVSNLTSLHDFLSLLKETTLNVPPPPPHLGSVLGSMVTQKTCVVVMAYTPSLPPPTPGLF